MANVAKRVIHVLRAGTLDYTSGLRLQQSLAARYDPKQEQQFQNFIILTEHKPVYTIGIRTKGYTDEDARRLTDLGAEFHRTNRGGLITFHGPGQLVAYPILCLKHFQPSLRWYVCNIERTIIDLCTKWGLRGKTSPDTGVWIEDRKICAIGLHASRYITTHGLALNCETDLRWFEHIVPCGIEGKGVTSLSQELGKTIGVAEAATGLLDSFGRLFDCEVKELDEEMTRHLLSAASVDVKRTVV